MKKKKITIIVSFIIIILFLSVFSTSKQKFTTKKVVSNQDDLKISIDGVPSENLPTSGNYYLTKYKCYSNKTKITWDRKNYKLNITNNNKKAGISCNLTFKSNPPISDMKIGSYIKYQGKYGNIGNSKITCKINGSSSSNNQTDNTESPNSCLGQNAREDIDNKTYGYCYNSNYKFYTTGWRIAYLNRDGKDLKTIIISAASPECTNNSNSNYLNTESLKYCNNDYVDNKCSCEDKDENGICDKESSDAWNINEKDFYKMTSSLTNDGTNINSFDINDCFNKKSTIACGYNNDLIDNGGYYWFDNNNNTYWNPDNRTIFTEHNKSFGLRPLIQLSSSVVVTDGEGTIDNPYIISNNDFTINNGDKYTNKKEVQLNIMASSASKMCISNNTKCEKYTEFSNKVNWTLSNKDGTKNVYVYLKDNKDKLLATMNGKIILDTIGPTNNKLEVIDKTANKVKIEVSTKGADKMCLNISDNIDSCNWIPYQKEYEFILDDKDGIKTIYGFFKDKAGNISSKSLTYNCETCSNAFTVSYNFDGTKNINEINSEKYIKLESNGEYPWIIDSINKHLTSNNKGIDNTTSNMIIEIKPTTKASLSFDYGVSSEANYDKLSISMKEGESNNILVNSISGTKEDKINNYSLEANKTYKLLLSYKKDDKGSVGKDIGYIKNIIIK